MDQDTPKKKDSRAGKLRFPLEGRKKKKLLQLNNRLKYFSKKLKKGVREKKKKGVSAYQ